MTIKFKKTSSKSIFTVNEVKGIDGKEYLFDVGESYNGKVSIHSYWYDEKGGCWGNADYEQKIWDLKLEYNTENIIKALNIISKEKITEIEIV